MSNNVKLIERHRPRFVILRAFARNSSVVWQSEAQGSSECATDTSIHQHKLTKKYSVWCKIIWKFPKCHKKKNRSENWSCSHITTPKKSTSITLKLKPENRHKKCTSDIEKLNATNTKKYHENRENEPSNSFSFQHSFCPFSSLSPISISKSNFKFQTPVTILILNSNRATII